MLDFKELEKELNDALDKETSETLNKWLSDRRNRNKIPFKDRFLNEDEKEAEKHFKSVTKKELLMYLKNIGVINN